jgi:hypothetical protein
MVKFSYIISEIKVLIMFDDIVMYMICKGLKCYVNPCKFGSFTLLHLVELGRNHIHILSSSHMFILLLDTVTY